MAVIRNRKVGSVKTELVKKSREAALAAVQIFNNPNMRFKSESYIVLMNIAWTYLLHAYYREKRIEYRYFDLVNKRKKFTMTKHGAYKHWELEKCLNYNKCPVDNNTSNNLKFLIGLRHEIEHQMTSQIDDLLSARFQACCLNYNEYLKKFFGEKLGIEKHLSFSLQFSTIGKEQKDLLVDQKNLPANIFSFIQNFDNTLSDEQYSSQKYAYRILFVEKTANRKGQADRVIEFVKSDSPLAENLNKEYAVVKEIDKKKYLPSQIVSILKKEGYKKFNMQDHTTLWKKLDAKNPSLGYGIMVADKSWYYYESWIDVIRKHCVESGEKYK